MFLTGLAVGLVCGAVFHAGIKHFIHRTRKSVVQAIREAATEEEENRRRPIKME